MNLDKLDEAIAYIEANPSEHDQATWLNANCGTTACLAGHVSLLNGGVPLAELPNHVAVGSRVVHVADYGREVLDLTSEQYDSLFFADDLAEIKALRDMYAGVERRRAARRAAATSGEAGERSDHPNPSDLGGSR